MSKHPSKNHPLTPQEKKLDLVEKTEDFGGSNSVTYEREGDEWVEVLKRETPVNARRKHEAIERLEQKEKAAKTTKGSELKGKNDSAEEEFQVRKAPTRHGTKIAKKTDTKAEEALDALTLKNTNAMEAAKKGEEP